MLSGKAAILFTALVWIGNFPCQSFSIVGHQGSSRLANDFGVGVSPLNMFFADSSADEKVESTETSDLSVSDTSAVEEEPAPVIMVSSDDDGFLNMAGSFLVDAFWLNSEHHQIDKTVEITSDARTNLMIEQASDLQDKYGAIMGKRLLDAAVIAALDAETKEFVGVVTVKLSLLEKDDIIDSESAEVLVRNAVASLGPKQRRQYKDAPVDVIAKELMPADVKAVCVLSNLAVSVKARRRGIASALCSEAEALAKDWGYDAMHLLVESENVSARNLYEKKLGYSLDFTNEARTALRVDIENGEFIQTQADTLILSKEI